MEIRTNVGQPIDGARFHGALEVRGSARVPLSPIHEGRFGRMFRRLPPAPDYADATLHAAAEAMREGAATWGTADLDNHATPAGFTYVGQFVDHDITFDPASSLQKRNDPDALRSFRSPRFDLDSVYGSGPSDEPFMYDRDSDGTRFLLGSAKDGAPDLPRNTQQTALVGDPRNDENIIVSQMHLAFLQFHNQVVDRLQDEESAADPADLFIQAQQQVRWHYQWAVVHDFVARLVGDDVFNRLWTLDGDGLPEVRTRFYRPRNNAYMPVEFSAAAFRFGHSMVRPSYDLSAHVTDRPIFVGGTPTEDLADLRGGRQLPAGWTIDWLMFLPSGTANPQPSRRIDGRLADALFNLPHGGDSLAFRNLKRGQALSLPSGQDVARQIGASVLSGAELGVALDPTPLWLYILREAEVDTEAAGRHLGPVGARIVGEVLLGMLEADATSFYRTQRTWRPTLPAAGGEGTFTFADLVAFAGSG